MLEFSSTVLRAPSLYQNNWGNKLTSWPRFIWKPTINLVYVLIIFRVRHSRGEMYIGHSHLCVCLSVPCRIPTLLHRPRCNLGNGKGFHVVMHYWADLQLVHGFCCYDNIAPNAKCQRVLVITRLLYAWLVTKVRNSQPRVTLFALFLQLQPLQLWT